MSEAGIIHRLDSLTHEINLLKFGLRELNDRLDSALLLAKMDLARWEDFIRQEDNLRDEQKLQAEGQQDLVG